MNRHQYSIKIFLNSACVSSAVISIAWRSTKEDLLYHAYDILMEIDVKASINRTCWRVWLGYPTIISELQGTFSQ